MHILWVVTTFAYKWTQARSGQHKGRLHWRDDACFLIKKKVVLSQLVFPVKERVYTIFIVWAVLQAILLKLACCFMTGWVSSCHSFISCGAWQCLHCSNFMVLSVTVGFVFHFSSINWSVCCYGWLSLKENSNGEDWTHVLIVAINIVILWSWFLYSVQNRSLISKAFP